MARDRSLTEEQGGGYLPISLALGDQRGNAALGCSQPGLALAAADPPELGARFGGPTGRAERLEALESSLEGDAGRELLSFPTPDDAQREQGPGATERIIHDPVLGDRLLEQLERRVDLALRGSHQAAAARRVREYPLASHANRVSLPNVEYRERVVVPAEGEQQLDVVGAPPANARLTPPQLRRLPVCAVEPLSRSGKVAAPECCQSHDREMLRRMQRELLLGEIERASRVLARELELAPVDGDDGDREVVLRHLEPVLDRDVMSMGGVLGGDVPTPCPELDPREPPERPSAPRLVLLPPFEVLALEEEPGPRLSSKPARKC